MTRLLRTAEVAAMTGVKESTLRTWRSERRGPGWFRLCGVVVYDEAELLAWIAAQAREQITEAATGP